MVSPQLHKFEDVKRLIELPRSTNLSLNLLPLSRIPFSCDTPTGEFGHSFLFVCLSLFFVFVLPKYILGVTATYTDMLCKS